MPAGVTIHVVAAILFRQDDRFLIARKRVGKPMAGLWEFPGGKLNEGETAEQALYREIAEELSLEITSCQLFCSYSYQKGERSLHFTFFTCRFREKEPILTDHDAIAWITADETGGYAIAPPDQQAVSLLIDRLRNLTDDPS